VKEEKKNPISGSTNSGAPPPPPIPRRGARPRIGARNQKKNEKKWAGAGTGEEEKSGAGDVVRRANLFLVAPRPPPGLHREKMIWIEEGDADLGLKLERGQRKNILERGFFGKILETQMG
jgi:hypothetical protein